MRTSHNNKYPNQSYIKKRHWCLGSAVILLGSWITHTTTATISNVPVDNTPIATFANFSEPVSPSSISDPQALLADELVIDYSTAIIQAEHAAEPLKEELYKIKSGDSLGSIFAKLDYDLSIPHHISNDDIAKKLVSLSIGRELLFKSDENGLRELHYPVNKLQNLVVTLEQERISSANIIDLPYLQKNRSLSGTIKSSLYESALEVGMSNRMIMEMLRIFGWDIDFAQDLKTGDSFHVIFEEYLLDGSKISEGNILAAEFTTQNKTHRAIRFEDDEANASYYTPDGHSMLGTFLRSPVEFSRISSRFGKRKHPILKKWRAHKGVDYAASRGTPIRATADGKIVLARKKGGYGKTVVIRHAGRFSTLYAHMNGYAKGIRSGSRVKQGQVIGYIGSSGLATGPHLHYEFRVDGVHRNPLTYKTPKASSIKAEHQSEFKQLAQSWLVELDSVSRIYQLAQANSDITTTL